MYSRWCRIAVALLFATSACRAPDVQPFADATAELHVAVASGGRAVRAELERAGLSDQAESFAKEWTARNKAMRAMTDYSSALVDIVAAARGGSDTIDRLGNELMNLSGALGVAVPATAAVGVATDTAKFVYAQIANVRAQRSLDAALVQSQPIVDRLAQLLSEDLAASLQVVQAANEMVATQLTTKHNAFIGYRKQLEDEVNRHDVSSLDDAGLAKRAKLSELLEQSGERHAQMRAEFEAKDKRLRLELELIDAASDACSAWAAAHRQLAAAVRDSSRVSVSAVVSSAKDLKALVERMRDL